MTEERLREIEEKWKISDYVWKLNIVKELIAKIRRFRAEAYDFHRRDEK